MWKSEENIRKTYLFFKCIFTKNVIFGLQTTFFYGFNVLMSFLAEKMMQNDLEITSESQFWTQNMQNSTKTLHSDMSGRSAGSWGTVEV